MKEQAPRSQEQHKSVEHHVSNKEKREHQNIELETALKSSEKVNDSLDTIRASIDKQATKSKSDQYKNISDDADQSPSSVRIDRNLKQKAYKKEIHRIQTHLPKSQRSFSKFIHSPAIESASEAGGKTVARPSGLLGGGLVALVGSSTLLIISRHYGFSYNFFVFLVLLVGGFFVGLLIEMLVRSLIKIKS